jgi:hypothetical protein
MLGRIAVLISSSAILAMAGCGGDDGGGGGGRLADALSSVSAGPAAGQAFLWSDVAAVREAGGFPDRMSDLEVGPAQRRWLIPLGTGAGRLMNVGVPAAEDLGIDVLSADQAITIGNPPQTAVRLDGVDAQAAHDGLVAHAGARPARLGDHDVLTRGQEGEVDPADPLGAALIGIGNRMVAADETVALSGSDASLEAVLGDGGDTLADEPGYGAAADCLGDVLSAEIYPGRQAGADVDLVAIGVRGGDAPTEVLCAVGDDGQAGALRTHLAPDSVTPDTRQHVSDLVAQADVDTGEAGGDHYARALLTLAGDRPAGFLTQALQRRALAAYLGR